ncbi:MAG: nucleotidyltransferase family protein [bacterium]
MKTNNRFSVKAQGNSMYPLLQDGDIIEYIQVPFHAIRLNDIILVYKNNILVTHRVIYKTKTTCITRGDNNDNADIPIQKKQILAKVVRFKRKGVWHELQEAYFAQSTLYLNEIQRLETILQFKKIPHAFLKGVLISLRYEGYIPKRIYADCDILASHNGYKQIKHVFSSLGYKPIPLANTDSVPYFKKINQQPEVNFVKIVQGVPIVFDVHFEPVFLMSRLQALSLLYPNRLLQNLGDTLLSNTTPQHIKGFNYSLCSVPDQILYLALHIFHHNYTDSVRYQLLDTIIRKSATKKTWNDVQNTVTTYRLEGYVYTVFILLRKYFKTPIPQSFFTTICLSPFKKKISNYLIKRVDVFSQDSRMRAGIKRFILIFLFSPEPWVKKLLLFIHPEVLYTGAKMALSILILPVSWARQQLFKSK